MNPLGDLFTHVIYALYLLAAVFVPVILCYAFVRIWLRYVRADFRNHNKGILLELKLPKDITKSPAAMELVFTALYQTAATSFLETFWLGKVRPIFSFELVSIEGKVKFFIWTRASFKNIVESQIYAQYPNVEIYEVPDYTDLIEHNQDDMIMWGTYFKKKVEGFFPIKTYIDYGMDEVVKEEYQIDPMTSVLEYLGSLGKDEYAWIQILIQAHKSEGINEGNIFHKRRPDWKKAARETIQTFREEASEKANPDSRGFQQLTRGQQETITAMERNLSKFPFECMIRAFYIAKKDGFNSTLGITGLIGSFRQYSSAHMNNLGLGWFTDHDDFGKDMVLLFGWFPPFRKAMRHRRDRMEQRMLQAYRDRGAFESQYVEHNLIFKRTTLPFIMTTEELATVYHLPGNVATTPTFDRIMAKKAEAPSNLPI